MIIINILLQLQDGTRDIWIEKVYKHNDKSICKEKTKLESWLAWLLLLYNKTSKYNYIYTHAGWNKRKLGKLKLKINGILFYSLQ